MIPSVRSMTQTGLPSDHIRLALKGRLELWRSLPKALWRVDKAAIMEEQRDNCNSHVCFMSRERPEARRRRRFCWRQRR